MTNFDLLFPFKWLLFACKWVRWALRGPYRYGDPSLGTGETREQNRAILNQRWDEAEPKFRKD